MNENKLPDKLDMVGYLAWCISTHEDIKEIITSNGQKLHRILANNCGCTSWVMQQS